MSDPKDTKELGERLRGLTPRQRELLEKKLAAKAMGAETPVPSPTSQAPPGKPGGSEDARLAGVAANYARLEEQGLAVQPPSSPGERRMDFGIFFFSDSGMKPDEHKYRLLLESAKFADRHGFCAVWTPERHFHEFGGLYPNPSVLGAALAVATENVEIRAGSCVPALHHPVRITEEWAVVDNLSRGRVGLSFASGWSPDDFILSSIRHEERKEEMFRLISEIRSLWRREPGHYRDRQGREVEPILYPPPVQPELPVWIASAGNPKIWLRAAEIGANILTALLSLNVDELASNIRLWRRALAAHGHDPDKRKVALMLHTFLGEDEASVRRTVYGPLTDYLRRHVRIYEDPKVLAGLGLDVDPTNLTEDDMRALTEMAFERYFNTSGLFGRPEDCLPLVDQLQAVGVTEIACLVDYGVDSDAVLASLEPLERLRRHYDGSGRQKEAPASRQIPAEVGL